MAPPWLEAADIVDAMSSPFYDRTLLWHAVCACAKLKCRERLFRSGATDVLRLAGNAGFVSLES